MEEDLILKSQLILDGGGMKVPQGFDHPYADPKGDGTGSIIASFGGTRFRMRYSPDKGKLELCSGPEGYYLTRNGEPFIDHIEFVQAFCHSPEQANVNLGKFSSVEDILAYVDRIVSTGTVKGIPVSLGPDSTLDDCIEVIGKIHSRYPEIPIGLSYEAADRETMMALKNAGLTEFKVSVGSTVPRIFEALHENGDMQSIMRCLEEAVDIFGKGKVCSGLFAGLGETDDEMEKSIRDLSSIGVLTDLKVKKNRKAFEEKLGRIEPLSVERLSMFGRMLKDIEAEYGLDPRTMDTLCLACRCCNLVAFKDY